MSVSEYAKQAGLIGDARSVPRVESISTAAYPSAIASIRVAISLPSGERTMPPIAARIVPEAKYNEG
eukprot:scaffold49326_cov29-Tisochrysis_lutea.AAC.7